MEITFTVELKAGKWQVNGRTFKDMTAYEREAVDKFIKSYDSDSIDYTEVLNFEKL